jgi:hypothetical protein
MWKAFDMRGIGRRHRHASRLVGAYKQYYNEVRPYRGIGQRIPERSPAIANAHQTHRDQICARGFHYDCWSAAQCLCFSMDELGGQDGSCNPHLTARFRFIFPDLYRYQVPGT